MQPINNLVRLASVGTLGVLVAAVPLGFAQPEDRPAQASGRESDQATPPPADRSPERGRNRASIDDPEVLRSRLESAITRGERMLERQRDAVARLDAGESPAEVMRSLRTRATDDADPSRRARREAGEDAGAPADRRGPQGANDRARDERPQFEPDAETLRAVVREHFPELYQQLEAITQGSPEAGEHLFMRLAPRIREIAIDMRHDPDLGTLRVNEVRAGMGVGDANGALRQAKVQQDEDSIAEAEGNLRAAIGVQFDARVALRQHEVERLVGRIGELNDEILEEIANREAAIDTVYESIVNRRRPRRGGRQP